MKRNKLCMAFGTLAMLACAAAAQTRTQTVSLTKGWNAVWLEVEPETAVLEALFEGQPVDIVAAYTLPVSEAQFVKSTDLNVQSLAGWSVWYAPHRADAPLSRLSRLAVNHGYLMHALEAATLTVRGKVRLSEARWTPNSYNLVGFSVQEQGAPTFKQFFQGSPAHNHAKIYRLASGVWRKVLTPDAETLRSGEAFWIYCDGASDYPGPLMVRAGSKQGVFVTDSTTCDVAFLNRTIHPLAFTLEQVTEQNDDVPLAAMVRLYQNGVMGVAGEAPVRFDSGNGSQTFPSYEAGEGVTVPLALRPQGLASGTYQSLLKVTSDLGSVTYLPLTAVKE